MKLQRDTGNFERIEKFYLDPNAPKKCQQTSAKAYGRNYDCDLVPATMNRGAWLLIEDYCDIDALLAVLFGKIIRIMVIL